MQYRLRRMNVPVEPPKNVAENQEEVKMKKSVFFGALTVAGLAAGAAAAGTLDDVKARGKLNCGVTTGLVGFAAPDANGEWKGFDVAVCRAVAAAVLGDPDSCRIRSDNRQDTLYRAGFGRDRHAGT